MNKQALAARWSAVKDAAASRWSAVKTATTRFWRRHFDNLMILPVCFAVFAVIIAFIVFVPALVLGLTLMTYLKTVAFFAWIVAAIASIHFWLENN